MGFLHALLLLLLPRTTRRLLGDRMPPEDPIPAPSSSSPSRSRTKRALGHTESRSLSQETVSIPVTSPPTTASSRRAHGSTLSSSWASSSSSSSSSVTQPPQETSFLQKASRSLLAFTTSMATGKRTDQPTLLAPQMTIAPTSTLAADLSRRHHLHQDIQHSSTTPASASSSLSAPLPESTTTTTTTSAPPHRMWDVPEIIRAMAEFLDKPSLASACRVSHLWNAHCTPHLWRHIVDKNWRHSHFCRSIQARSGDIRSMKCEDWTDYEEMTLCSFPRLQGLAFHGGKELIFVKERILWRVKETLVSLGLSSVCAEMKVETFRVIMGLNNLRTLKISGTVLTHRGLAGILKECTQLEFLSLSRVGFRESSGLGQEAEDEKSYEKVFLNEADDSFVATSALTTITMARGNRNHPQLYTTKIKYLALKDVPLSCHYLSEITRLCPLLLELSLARNEDLYLTGALIASIRKTCPDLYALDISSCKLLDSEAFLTIFAQLGPQLTVLNLSGTLVSDSDLEHLAKECRRLRRLDIQYCTVVTGVGLHRFLSGCDESLRHLEASGVVMDPGEFDARKWRCRNLETLFVHIGLFGPTGGTRKGGGTTCGMEVADTESEDKSSGGCSCEGVSTRDGVTGQHQHRHGEHGEHGDEGSTATVSDVWTKMGLDLHSCSANPRAAAATSPSSSLTSALVASVSGSGPLSSSSGSSSLASSATKYEIHKPEVILVHKNDRRSNINHGNNGESSRSGASAQLSSSTAPALAETSILSGVVSISAASTGTTTAEVTEEQMLHPLHPIQDLVNVQYLGLMGYGPKLTDATTFTSSSSLAPASTSTSISASLPPLAPCSSTLAPTTSSPQSFSSPPTIATSSTTLAATPATSTTTTNLLQGFRTVKRLNFLGLNQTFSRPDLVWLVGQLPELCRVDAERYNISDEIVAWFEGLYPHIRICRHE